MRRATAIQLVTYGGIPFIGWAAKMGHNRLVLPIVAVQFALVFLVAFRMKPAASEKNWLIERGAKSARFFRLSGYFFLAWLPLSLCSSIYAGQPAWTISLGVVFQGLLVWYLFHSSRSISQKLAVEKQQTVASSENLTE